MIMNIYSPNMSVTTEANIVDPESERVKEVYHYYFVVLTIYYSSMVLKWFILVVNRFCKMTNFGRYC
jgi:hypothetical protein